MMPWPLNNGTSSADCEDRKSFFGVYYVCGLLDPGTLHGQKVCDEQNCPRKETDK